MEFQPGRLRRELETMATMIGCYCRGRHGTDGALCPDCRRLLDYATVRLQRCPYGETKPTCAKCPIHCYQPEVREKVKAVMLYAGLAHDLAASHSGPAPLAGCLPQSADGAGEVRGRTWGKGEKPRLTTRAQRTGRTRRQHPVIRWRARGTS